MAYPDVTFTLTDAELRAVLFACSIATDRPALWNGNDHHRLAAVAAREKIYAVYAAQEVDREATGRSRKSERR